MNELILKTKQALYGKGRVGLRMPSLLGLLIGYIADLFSSILKIKMPLSSIRVRKFIGTTQFGTSIYEKTNFEPPFTLQEGLEETIKYEFLNQNKNEKAVFETE